MLAEQFAQIVAPLLGGAGEDLSLSAALALVPTKPLHARPWALHDGGGKVSQADWSFPSAENALQHLRTVLLQFSLRSQADKRLLARATYPKPEPLFSQEGVESARALVFPALGIQPPQDAWHIRPDQPMCLNAFEALAKFCNDPDNHLFPALRAGVPTGFQRDIPPSGCFWEQDAAVEPLTPLSLHLQNWKSAEVDASVTSRLLQEELDAGYCYKFPGSVAEAQRAFPVGLALGKLGVVRAPGRSDRLVLDNSICGTNANCEVPETQAMPSALDVMHSFPLRECQGQQMAMCIDVKAAHKRVVIRASEQGLLGFTWQDEIYFYKVAHFGATFAQHWWGRVGSCALRLLHILIWIARIGMLFVDDYLFSQDCQIMPLTGAMICLFFQILGIPLSWKKLQLSHRVEWIGWHFCFSAGIISLKTEKCHKLLGMVQSLLSGHRVSKKDLEKFIGLSLWACLAFPTMKAMLHTFYHDLWAPAATNFSIPPDYWHDIARYLDDNLRFCKMYSHM